MTKTETAFFSINTVTEVTKRQVQNLLVDLFETCCPSWLHRVEHVNLPVGLALNDFRKGGKMQSEEYFHWTQIVPVTDGCSLTLLVDNPDYKHYSRRQGPLGYEEKLPEFKEFVLDIEAIQKGLQIMAEKYPRQWKKFIDENDDADTSDIFGQCVVYGEVIYG